MPRFPRQLRLFCPALPPLLFVATLAMWARSHGRVDLLGCDTWGGHYQLVSDRGALEYDRMPGATPGEFQTGYQTWSWRPGTRHPTPLGEIGLGFASYSGPHGWSSGPTARYISAHRVPYWFICTIAALASAWPAWRLVRAARRRRHADRI